MGGVATLLELTEIPVHHHAVPAPPQQEGHEGDEGHEGNEDPSKSIDALAVGSVRRGAVPALQLECHEGNEGQDVANSSLLAKSLCDFNGVD